MFKNSKLTKINIETVIFAFTMVNLVNFLSWFNLLKPKALKIYLTLIVESFIICFFGISNSKSIERSNSDYAGSIIVVVIVSRLNNHSWVRSMATNKSHAGPN